jgi:4-hydroxy 2-oxovalerate aldolase
MKRAHECSILDVTIRDGSYAINYQFTPEQVGKIVAALDHAGIDLIEVSHGCGLGARENLGLPGAASDAEYVHAAKEAAKRAKIGVIAGGAPVTYPKDIDTIIDAVDFIRFGANCHAPRTIESNVTYALTKRPNLPIFLQLMRSTRRPLATLLQAGHEAESMGIQTLYVVDTAGHFLPEEVTEIVAALSSELRIAVGFHGHDNLGLAIANSLAAVQAGASSVDASLRGMGRAGGNAQLESLISCLHRKGIASHIELDPLLAAGRDLVVPIMPERFGIDSIDLLTADANIDLYPLPFYQRIAETAGVPFEALVRALGADASAVEAGIDELRRALSTLGADPVEIFKKLGIEV